MGLVRHLESTTHTSSINKFRIESVLFQQRRFARSGSVETAVRALILEYNSFVDRTAGTTRSVARHGLPGRINPAQTYLCTRPEPLPVISASISERVE